MIKYTAAKMAEIKGVGTEEMIELARENGRPLYKALGFGENKENMGLDAAPKTNG